MSELIRTPTLFAAGEVAPSSRPANGELPISPTATEARIHMLHNPELALPVFLTRTLRNNDSMFV
jgi:hypothetical protein